MARLVFATMQQHYLLTSHCQDQHRALPYAIFCVQVPINMCMLMHMQRSGIKRASVTTDLERLT